MPNKKDLDTIRENRNILSGNHLVKGRTGKITGWQRNQ